MASSTGTTVQRIRISFRQAKIVSGSRSSVMKYRTASVKVIVEVKSGLWSSIHSLSLVLVAEDDTFFAVRCLSGTNETFRLDSHPPPHRDSYLRMHVVATGSTYPGKSDRDPGNHGHPRHHHSASRIPYFPVVRQAAGNDPFP